MRPDEALRLNVGDRCVVRTASNDLSPAVLASVPTNWRDSHRSAVVTSMGAFPKMWVKLQGGKRTYPWPVEDVFVHLEEAQKTQSTKEETPQ